MTSVGGLICEEGQRHILESCDFSSLDFVRTGTEPFDIEVPSLTFKELRLIDAELPSDDLSNVGPAGVPKEDVSRYAKVYRYFPTFVDAEF